MPRRDNLSGMTVGKRESGGAFTQQPVEESCVAGEIYSRRASGGSSVNVIAVECS